MDKFIEQAELLLKNKLIFIHPFDMERCNKIYDIPNDWNETPNNDDEWIYMRSRMGYFDSLMYMYDRTRNIKYIGKIKEIILSFIECHEFLKYEKSTRTLDSGIRLVNILRVLIFFEKNNINYDKKIIEHMKNTCYYLFNSYISKYDQSNWGIIQMAGVYTYALYFKDENIKIKAFQFLKKQLMTQVLDDGMHWEKSQTYHYQIIIYLIFIIYISKKVGESDNVNVFIKYLKKLTYAAKNLHYPDYTQINFGDSDDDEIESVLSLAKYILNEKSEYRITDISKLFIPEAKITVKEKNIKRKVAKFLESGYVHIYDNKFSLSTYCTPMSSSHTHIDYLHFNYYYNKKIFVDNGRYTYVENDIRTYLKSVYAHNSIIIDSSEASKITGSWEYEKYPNILPIYILEKENYCIIKLGIYDNVNNALIERQFININENVIIINKVKCKGNHKVTLQYHLYPNTNIEKINKGLLLNNEIKFFINDYNIQKGIYSPTYNVINESQKICKTKKFEDEYFEINTILNKDVDLEKLDVYQKNKKINDDSAIAYKLKTKKGDYIIFIKPNEIYKGQKVFHVEGIPFYENIKIVRKGDV